MNHGMEQKQESQCPNQLTFGKQRWRILQETHLHSRVQYCYCALRANNQQQLPTTMMDMFNMMGKVKELQARLKEAQDNLVHVKASGESGGGMVKAVVNGKKLVVSLEIDPSLLKVDNQVILQDLIVA